MRLVGATHLDTPMITHLKHDTPEYYIVVLNGSRDSTDITRLQEKASSVVSSEWICIYILFTTTLYVSVIFKVSIVVAIPNLEYPTLFKLASEVQTTSSKHKVVEKQYIHHTFQSQQVLNNYAMYYRKTVPASSFKFHA